MISLALAIVALILGIISLVKSKFTGEVGWAIVALALAHLLAGYLTP